MHKTRHRASDLLEAQLKKIRRRKAVFAQIRRMAVIAGMMYLLFGVVFGISVVHGDSMEPVLHNGDIVFFYRLYQNYSINDIVLAEKDGDGDYIKRIVGLPGQTVDIDTKEHGLKIDGEVVSEPFIYEKTNKKTGCRYPLTLGKDEYFLLGDHRENSVDSRNYGAMAVDKLHGVAIAELRLGQ